MYIYTYVHMHNIPHIHFDTRSENPVTLGVLDLWPVTCPDSTDPSMEKKTVEIQTWVRLIYNL